MFVCCFLLSPSLLLADVLKDCFFFLSSALGSRWPSIGRTCENVDFPACLERACFDFKSEGGGSSFLRQHKCAMTGSLLPCFTTVRCCAQTEANQFPIMPHRSLSNAEDVARLFKDFDVPTDYCSCCT